MASVKRDVELLRDEVADLGSVAREHSEISTELLERVETFEDEVSRVIGDAFDLTSSEIAAFRTQLSALQSEVSKAIAIVGALHYKGQVRQAQAQFVGDVFRGILGAVGSAVLGILVSAGLEAAAEKVADAIKGKDPSSSEQDLKKLGLLGLIHDLETKRPYLTFKYILDVASSETRGLFTREEAKLYLSALVGGGLLEKYIRGNIRAVRLNRSHSRVKALTHGGDKLDEPLTLQKLHRILSKLSTGV